MRGLLERVLHPSTKSAMASGRIGHRALAYCLRMIFFGKPVPSLGSSQVKPEGWLFPDHALDRLE